MPKWRKDESWAWTEKSGIEKQMAGVRQVAEGLQAGFAIQTRNRSCEILQGTAQPHRKLGKKALLVSSLAQIIFFFLLSIFLTSVAFSQGKDTLQGHFFFFFFSW